MKSMLKQRIVKRLYWMSQKLSRFDGVSYALDILRWKVEGVFYCPYHGKFTGLCRDGTFCETCEAEGKPRLGVRQWS